MSVYVCLGLSVCTHISETACSKLTNFATFFAPVSYSCNSVLLWRRCDASRMPDFTDGVMLIHNGQEYQIKSNMTLIMVDKPQPRRRECILKLTHQRWRIMRSLAELACDICDCFVSFRGEIVLFGEINFHPKQLVCTTA